MESLPITVLRLIVSFVDSNMDRLMLSLVCKRWFEHRDKYMSFETRALATSSDYGESVIRLNSYKHVFDESFKSKWFTICVFSSTRIPMGQFEYIASCYDRTFITGGEGDHSWKHEILELPLIESIRFDDSILEAEWAHMGTFFDELTRRGVTDLTVDMTYPIPLRDMPIRTMRITCREPWTAQPSFFPTTLTKLSIYAQFSGTLDNMLPAGLKYLSLPDAWNHPLGQNALPTGLETLRLGDQYSQSLDRVLPPALTELRIPAHESYKSLVVPSSLTSLTIGYYTNTLIDNANLKMLDVIYPPPSFEQHISLVELTIHNFSWHNVDIISSSSFPCLERLNIRTHPITNHNPLAESPDLTSLPSRLRWLEIKTCSGIRALPEKLENLALFCTSEFSLHKGLLPSALQNLILVGYSHELQYDTFPLTLRQFKPCRVFIKHNPNLLEMLPISVVDIRLPLLFNDHYLWLYRMSADLYFRHSINLLRCGFIKRVPLLLLWRSIVNQPINQS
ncbi:hypothetical protein SAMD00019534_062210 [Acytostelium subglobosum LB1]|uniref:hypothetical protein n=1 Tax=Acytostelium subglobosum LB1 TaxID=1410327 RepID=UPI000645156F|nr:hypothetical protein SAMD00019534_062210 [Acytostelium subglobosum LB1]GAM23046.1 hypothetical protein SAMD00019534_062210 [Acytostelium subglobosum LB1]|eukprot:XP_012754273.1 hypothetical protein SAMD00019534_062210 [Acytostelium subglobosum LB1]